MIPREMWFFPEWNFEGLKTAARIRKEPAGWSATLAVPAAPILKRLGKKEFAAGMTLRANFVRLDYAPESGKQAVITNWAPVVAGRVHRSPAGMGYLILRAPK